MGVPGACELSMSFMREWKSGSKDIGKGIQYP